MTIFKKLSVCFKRDCESLRNLQISCLDPCIKWVKFLYLFPAECLQSKWNSTFSRFFLKIRPFYSILSRLLHRTRNREVSRSSLNSSLFSTTQKLIITKFINWDQIWNISDFGENFPRSQTAPWFMFHQLKSMNNLWRPWLVATLRSMMCIILFGRSLSNCLLVGITIKMQSC